MAFRRTITTGAVLLFAFSASATITSGASAAWTPPTSVSPEGQSVLGYQVVAAKGPADSVYVTWRTGPVNPEPGESRAIQLAKITSDGTVTPPIPITTDPAAELRSIAVAPDGAATVAWMTGSVERTLVVAVRISPGGEIGPLRTLYSSGSNAGGELGPVVVDSAGRATVTWVLAAERTTFTVMSASLRPDGTVTAPQVLGAGQDPSAAVQPNGRVVVVWTNFGVESSTQSTTLSADGTPGSAVELDPGRSTYSATVATAPDGLGAIAWNRADGETMTRRVRSDGALAPAIQLSPARAEITEPPRVAVSPSGLAVIAWSAGQDIWMVSTTPTGGASAARHVTLPPTAPRLVDGVAVDAAGTSTIVSTDQGTEDSTKWRVWSVTWPHNGDPEPGTVISATDEPRGPAQVFADSAGLVTALWTSFPHETAVVRMARTQPVPTCPGVKLIGVRGTDDSPGLGTPVRAVLDELVARNVLDTTAFIPVNYPAAGKLAYNGSVADGVTNLIGILKGDVCGEQSRYVLAGYSQGAEVIGSAIETGRMQPFRSRIVATLLFGDPRFDPRMTGIAFKGTFRPGKTGVLGGRSNTNLFVGYEARSFCRYLDPVCEGDRIRFARNDMDAHTHYGESEAKWGADLVANQILGQPALEATPLVQATLTGSRVDVSCGLPGSGVCQLVVRLGYSRNGSTSTTLLPDVRPYDSYRYTDCFTPFPKPLDPCHDSVSGATHTIDVPTGITNALRGKYNLVVQADVTAMGRESLEYAHRTTFRLPVK